jgi:hypothetical protein
MTKLFRAPVVALLVLSSPLALADVAVIPASKDATIFNDGVGAVASGAAKEFYAGLAGSNSSYPVRRALLAFDVAGAIPAGSTIQSVQLRLELLQVAPLSGPKIFTLRRLTSDWNEGPTVGFSGGGGTSQAGDVTWVHTNYPGSLWATPGGDFVAGTSASLTIGSVGTYTFLSTATLVSDVQLWLDTPAQSFGWILAGPETGTKNARKFAARNADTAAFRPQLTVTYLPPPVAVPYCTAKTTSIGCVPSIGFTGVPDANAGSGFLVTETNAINQKAGLMFYGTNGPKNAVFQGGFMCVQAPTLRTALQNSGGSPVGNDCTGTYSYDFNARIASGADPALVAGAQVWAQYWGRDPGDPFTTSLSDGLTFVIQP